MHTHLVPYECNNEDCSIPRIDASVPDAAVEVTPHVPEPTEVGVGREELEVPPPIEHHQEVIVVTPPSHEEHKEEEHKEERKEEEHKEEERRRSRFRGHRR